MSTAKFEKMRHERDTLKEENYILRTEKKILERSAKILEQTSSSVNATNLEGLRIFYQQQFTQLEQKVLKLQQELRKEREQLPHITLCVVKLLSMNDKKLLPINFFESDIEYKENYLAQEFQVTLLQAKEILQLFNSWRN